MFLTAKMKKGAIDGRLIVLLDTGVFNHVFCNCTLLLDMGPAPKPKPVTNNAGTIFADMNGTFPGIGLHCIMTPRVW